MIKLRDLRNGALFVTSDGMYGVKSEHSTPEDIFIPNENMEDPQSMCINLHDGHFLILPEGNDTLVAEIPLAVQSMTTEGQSTDLHNDYSWDEAKRERIILYAVTEHSGITYMYPYDSVTFAMKQEEPEFLERMQHAYPEARFRKVLYSSLIIAEQQRKQGHANA